MAASTHDIELVDVSKRFGDVLAVDHVSLNIERGRFYSFLGPSGCGKTTTLRMVAGFEAPTSGELRIGGVDMTTQPPFQRPVNTVFQSYAIFPHMTVYQNIAFGLEMKHVAGGEIKQRVSAALDMVRLPGTEKRYPSQLSGGQQQRVALARALVNRPRVLLLDEPLSALDRKLRQEMQLELKRLQREVGITFVYVTHDQEEALTMSDSIAVMNAGRVLQVGTPAEVYERPTSRFVADFIGETNFLNGRVRQVQGRQAEVECNGLTVIAVTARPLAPGASVTLAVRPENLVLAREPDAGQPNCFPATLQEMVYVGNDTRLTVRLQAPGTRETQVLRIRRQNTGSTLQVDPAARDEAALYVSFAPESAHILVD